MRREGEGLSGRLVDLARMEGTARNLLLSREALAAGQQALLLLAEAGDRLEEGQLYRALRAASKLADTYLRPPPAGSGGSGSRWQLLQQLGPLRQAVEREVDRIFGEVDRRSLVSFQEWLVAARREAADIGRLAMQRELDRMDLADGLLLTQEALKALLAVGEPPGVIAEAFVQGGLVDRPPEDAFFPELSDSEQEDEEQEEEEAEARARVLPLSGGGGTLLTLRPCC